MAPDPSSPPPLPGRGEYWGIPVHGLRFAPPVATTLCPFGAYPDSFWLAAGASPFFPQFRLYTESPMQNFKPFAIHYLNDWIRYDSGFVEGLSMSKPRADRLRCLSSAAGFYGVARTLPSIEEPERLGTALDSLDAMRGPIVEEAVDSTVVDLASTFQRSYGKYAISAASKFLWIRFQSPIVIYDSQVFWSLRENSSTQLAEGYYEPYRKEWLHRFADCKEAILSACIELVRAKSFSFAHSMPDDELMGLVSERWFHERVFDKYLWSGGSE